MNARLFTAGAAIALLAAASVSAQSTMSPDDMAKATHNETQTQSTVPGGTPGSPRAGAAATAPVVNTTGSSDVAPEDSTDVRMKAHHNEGQTRPTVPTNQPGSPRAGATATAPVVNNGDSGPPQ
jgi:hypothetical protein